MSIAPPRKTLILTFACHCPPYRVAPLLTVTPCWTACPTPTSHSLSFESLFSCSSSTTLLPRVPCPLAPLPLPGLNNELPHSCEALSIPAWSAVLRARLCSCRCIFSAILWAKVPFLFLPWEWLVLTGIDVCQVNRKRNRAQGAELEGRAGS